MLIQERQYFYIYEGDDERLITPNTIKRYDAKITELENVNSRFLEALKLIASCEKRIDGDVVDIAQKALNLPPTLTEA